MVFCSQCGKELNAGANFCGGCGAQQGGGGAPTPVNASGSVGGGSVQITSSSSDPPIPDKNLKDLKEQLEHLGRDRDRIRIVTAAADGHSFTTAQIVDLVETQHYGDAKNQTAILLYSKCTDQEKFVDTVLPCFNFEEDKQEIRDALGL